MDTRAVDDMMKSMRVLECANCHLTFGFQHKWQPELYYCTTRCLMGADLRAPINYLMGPGLPPNAGHAPVPRPISVHNTWGPGCGLPFHGCGTVQNLPCNMVRLSGAMGSCASLAFGSSSQQASRAEATGEGDNLEKMPAYVSEAVPVPQKIASAPAADTNSDNVADGVPNVALPTDEFEATQASNSAFVESGNVEDKVFEDAWKTESWECSAKESVDNEKITFTKKDSAGVDGAQGKSKTSAVLQDETVFDYPDRDFEDEPVAVTPLPQKLVRPTQAVKEFKSAPVAVSGLSNQAKTFSSAPSSKSGTAVSQIRTKWYYTAVAVSNSLKTGAACHNIFTWNPYTYSLLADEDKGKCGQLGQDISKYMDKAPKLSEMPCVNEVILAPWAKDVKCLVRAVVTWIDEDKCRLRIDYLDYGDSAKVTLESCRAVSDKIMEKHPAYSVKFNLTSSLSVIPTQLEKDCESVVKNLMEGIFYLQVDGEKTNLEWFGKLYEDKNKTRCLNDALDNIVDSKKSSEKVSVAASSETKGGKGVKVKQFEMPSQNKKSEISGFKDKNVQLKFSDAELSPNLQHGTTVRIIFSYSYKHLVVSSVKDQASMEQMDDEIARHSSTAPKMDRIPEVDEIVLAPYDGVYYRGRVVSANGKYVCVKFVDYGDEVQCKYSDCKGLSPKLIKEPIYGLDVIIPDVEDTKFTSDVIDKVSQNDFQLQKIEAPEKGKWVAKLWYSGGSQRGRWGTTVQQEYSKLKAQEECPF